MVDETANKSDMPDWDDLQGMWQESPPVDMDAMLRKARWVLWRMRLNFVCEIVISLFGIGLFASFIPGGGIAEITLGLYGMVFSGLGLWAAVYIRRGAWGHPDENALSLVQLLIKRAKSTILYFKLNSWLGVGGIFMIPIGYWVLYERFGTLDHERVDGVHIIFAMVILLFVAFPLFTRSIVRKKRREIAKLRLVEEQLLGEQNQGAEDLTP